MGNYQGRDWNFQAKLKNQSRLKISSLDWKFQAYGLNISRDQSGLNFFNRRALREYFENQLGNLSSVMVLTQSNSWGTIFGAISVILSNQFAPNNSPKIMARQVCTTQHGRACGLHNCNLHQRTPSDLLSGSLSVSCCSHCAFSALSGGPICAEGGDSGSQNCSVFLLFSSLDRLRQQPSTCCLCASSLFSCYSFCLGWHHPRPPSFCYCLTFLSPTGVNLHKNRYETLVELTFYPPKECVKFRRISCCQSSWLSLVSLIIVVGSVFGAEWWLPKPPKSWIMSQIQLQDVGWIPPLPLSSSLACGPELATNARCRSNSWKSRIRNYCNQQCAY